MARVPGRARRTFRSRRRTSNYPSPKSKGQSEAAAAQLAQHKFPPPLHGSAPQKSYGPLMALAISVSFISFLYISFYLCMSGICTAELLGNQGQNLRTKAQQKIRAYGARESDIQ